MTKFEKMARAICAVCGEDPDHIGDARGNEYRWQDYADAAQAAIDAMGDGWEPIETVPKDGSTIIVWFKPHGPLTVFWYDDIWCVDDMRHGPYPLRGYREDEATNWRPLPEPPK